MLKWILLGILAFIMILVIIWFFISSGKIRTYSEPNSLSEKFVKDINGAPNGFFITKQKISPTSSRSEGGGRSSFQSGFKPRLK